MSIDSSGHLKSLQSLRGLAALIVLIHHCFRILADADSAWLLSERILNAHAAVVIFFVLSGYVLMLSLLRERISAISILKFCLKRLFRIYPALWVGVSLGALYLFVLPRPPHPVLSDWANSLYQPTTIDLYALIGSFLGIKTELLPPLWTIKVELVASIIALPFIAILLTRQKGWIAATPLLLPLVLVSFIFPTSATLLYLYQFAIGAICAISSHRAPHRIQISSPIFLAAVVCLILFRQLFDWPYHHPLPSLFEAISSAIVILGLTQGKAIKFFSYSPMVRLGDVSYGIYILHLPIALATTAFAAPLLLEYGASPDFASISISIIVAGITALIASLMYRWIELPFVAIGRSAANSIAIKFSARTSYVE